MTILALKNTAADTDSGMSAQFQVVRTKLAAHAQAHARHIVSVHLQPLA